MSSCQAPSLEASLSERTTSETSWRGRGGDCASSKAGPVHHGARAQCAGFRERVDTRESTGRGVELRPREQILQEEDRLLLGETSQDSRTHREIQRSRDERVDLLRHGANSS